MKSAFSLLKNPLFLALDVDDFLVAKKFVKETADLVGGFKIGPRLVFRYGTDVIKEISQSAPVFLDFKFYDIPSTMDSSIRSAFECGASFATIHCLAGGDALKKLFETEKELSSKRPFSLLGVTLLTSYSRKTLPPNFVDQPIEEQVMSLTGLANDCGIRGIVCSPQELKLLKSKYPGDHFVTPGIRLESDAKDDQSRTATPQEALSWGASALVIGRSVLNAKNPREYLLGLLNDISKFNLSQK